jgi:Zn-dependent protease with chaperone function
LIVLGCYFLGFFIVGAAVVAGAGRDDRAAWAVAIGAAGFAGLIAGMVLSSRAIRRAVIAVRNTKLRSSGRRRQAAAGVAVRLSWGFFVVIGISSKPLTGSDRDRLVRQAESAGVKVRGFRILDTRGQKIANAAQMGTIPGFRYVLLTDYSLDNLPPQQVDAVVAHELGHARRHHILIKLGAVLIVWAVLEGLAAAVSSSGHGFGGVLAVPIFIAIPVGMWLPQGLVGVRLEEAADDHAAALVGADELAAALELVGDLNDTKRNTGRGWALITQHPGLDARLRRLRDSAEKTPAA